MGDYYWAGPFGPLREYLAARPVENGVSFEAVHAYQIRVLYNGVFVADRNHRFTLGDGSVIYDSVEHFARKVTAMFALDISELVENLNVYEVSETYKAIAEFRVKNG